MIRRLPDAAAVYLASRSDDLGRSPGSEPSVSRRHGRAVPPPAGLSAASSPLGVARQTHLRAAGAPGARPSGVVRPAFRKGACNARGGGRIPLPAVGQRPCRVAAAPPSRHYTAFVYPVERAFMLWVVEVIVGHVVVQIGITVEACRVVAVLPLVGRASATLGAERVSFGIRLFDEAQRSSQLVAAHASPLDLVMLHGVVTRACPWGERVQSRREGCEGCQPTS
jgi:hypothetical protein